MLAKTAPSGEFVIFLLALPAFASPLQLLPVPEIFWGRPNLIRAVVMIGLYPRLWAGVATAFAVAWITRGEARRLRKIIGGCLAALAWIPAIHTSTVLAGWERF